MPNVYRAHIHHLLPSDDVTTGGSEYLTTSGGDVSSPTGGKIVLFVEDTVGTARALSALRLNAGWPLGDDDPLLLLRTRACTGETE